MGKKVPAERWIPKKPLPNQKLEPCDTELLEKAINGACWQETSGQPPCGRLYRSGDRCYRAVAADPADPLSQTP